MLTCKSPRKVLLVAYYAARRALPSYSCKFSRHDFTWPQLFACLVLREHQKKSYRGIEALLRDVHWCRQIGLRKVPDHNTLCRAFHAIMATACLDNILDALTRLMRTCRGMGIVVAMDSTYFDTHHHSRHYEFRCRQHASKDRKTANSRRAAAVRRIPKLILAVDTSTHLILAARTRVGGGGDQREFAPLLRGACRRVRIVRMAVADSGFDAHVNHVIARKELGVRTLIKADAGRPGEAVTSPYRRQMKRVLAGSQAGRPYGQRAQAETTNSMIKRNLGDCLRARSEAARSREQLLRVITHDVMIMRSARVETEPVRLSIHKHSSFRENRCVVALLREPLSSPSAASAAKTPCSSSAPAPP